MGKLKWTFLQKKSMLPDTKIPHVYIVQNSYTTDYFFVFYNNVYSTQAPELLKVEIYRVKGTVYGDVWGR